MHQELSQLESLVHTLLPHTKGEKKREGLEMGIRVGIPNCFRIIPKLNHLFLFPFQEDFTQHNSWRKRPLWNMAGNLTVLPKLRRE